MIKLIFLGLAATAAVWFVTSKDHVSNFIEKDLTKRVAEVLDSADDPDFTIAGRDVILLGTDVQSPAEVENTAADVSTVAGVERVFVIDSFTDPEKVSAAVVALTNQDNFAVAAHLHYNGSELNLMGNGTGEAATADLLKGFGETYDVAINDNLYYQGTRQEGDWVRALAAWIEFLPASGPGWIVIAANRIIVSMEDSKSVNLIGEKLSNLGLAFDVNYRNDDRAAAAVAVAVESVYVSPVRETMVVVSTSAGGMSLDECNQKLRSITEDGSINFKHSSDDLSASSLRSLAKVRDTLQECNQGLMTIAGHTDSLGDSQYNLELSTRRAGLVMDKLISLGVDPSRMRALGFGEDRPIANNDTKTGRWLNRRIEMTLE